MERPVETRRWWAKKWWVLVVAGVALIALANGVSPVFLAVVLICPLMMAGMHGGGHAGHGDMSQGSDSHIQQGEPQGRKDDGP